MYYCMNLYYNFHARMLDIYTEYFIEAHLCDLDCDKLIYTSLNWLI